jgi:hypothetical protein
MAVMANPTRAAAVVAVAKRVMIMDMEEEAEAVL